MIEALDRRHPGARRLIEDAILVLFAVAMIACGVVVVVVLKGQSHTDQHLAAAQRGQCRATNVVRDNQAGGLRDQIVQTDVSLRGDLGALEPFRRQVKAANDARKRRLRNLRVVPHPRGFPYLVDCARAYPDP